MVDRNNTEDNPTYFRRPPELRDIKTGGPSLPDECRLTPEGRRLLEVNQNATPLDLVYAVYCPYWPVEAEEWRKRKRFHGWPNEKLIARITRGGCHFVSKLRTWSSSDDTEWRFSFSKAEFLLIHSWTPDQKLAYHTIRVIKRRISESCCVDGSKGFQTYFLKTLMFWACEEFPPEFWGKQNIGICIATLFRRFRRCLEEKFCPSYFIPECNIMSHLKDEGDFYNESHMVHKFLNLEAVEVKCGSLQYGTFSLQFEHRCIFRMSHAFPLNAKLDGRSGQYLSECEWFLLGMKNLHAAIEAHLRLMSVDSVTERQRSKDYVVCLENFSCGLSKGEEFESCGFENGDLSDSENWIRTFVRKAHRNSVAIYLRWSHRDCVSYESFPSPLQGVTSAYRANFYFTAMKSYSESLSECEICFEVLHSKSEIGLVQEIPAYFSSYISLLLCNCLSQIFDEHLQVILGFATLHRNISFFNSLIIATFHEVCLKLNVWEFLKYMHIQCEQKLYSISELTDYSFALDLCPPYMSQLVDSDRFSAIILFAALRQSRAYKNSLNGCYIPDDFRRRKCIPALKRSK